MIAERGSMNKRHGDANAEIESRAAILFSGKFEIYRYYASLQIRYGNLGPSDAVMRMTIEEADQISELIRQQLDLPEARRNVANNPKLRSNWLALYSVTGRILSRPQV